MPTAPCILGHVYVHWGIFRVKACSSVIHFGARPLQEEKYSYLRTEISFMLHIDCWGSLNKQTNKPKPPTQWRNKQGKMKQKPNQNQNKNKKKPQPTNQKNQPNKQTRKSKKVKVQRILHMLRTCYKFFRIIWWQNCFLILHSIFRKEICVTNGIPRFQVSISTIEVFIFESLHWISVVLKKQKKLQQCELSYW